MLQPFFFNAVHSLPYLKTKHYSMFKIVCTLYIVMIKKKIARKKETLNRSFNITVADEYPAAICQTSLVFPDNRSVSVLILYLHADVIIIITEIYKTSYVIILNKISNYIK